MVRQQLPLTVTLMDISIKVEVSRLEIVITNITGSQGMATTGTVTLMSCMTDFVQKKDRCNGYFSLKTNINNQTILNINLLKVAHDTYKCK